MTHRRRDELEQLSGVDVAALITGDESFRCQCPSGAACHRASTQEDLRCDWCRTVDHARFCEQDYGSQPYLPADPYAPGGLVARVPWEVTPGPAELVPGFRGPEPVGVFLDEAARFGSLEGPTQEVIRDLLRPGQPLVVIPGDFSIEFTAGQGMVLRQRPLP